MGTSTIFLPASWSSTMIWVSKLKSSVFCSNGTQRRASTL